MRPGSRAVCVVVRGRVQGVGFRYAMCRGAQAADVCGWVRNRRDGSVEAHLQGDAQAVAALLDWTRQGPQGARVEVVEVAEAATDPALHGFVQRPTA
jgi:acylphosphatase